MTIRRTDYDVVISGGGMVGASLAWALAALPLRVALVEAVPFASADQPSFDDRTVALSRSSQKILAGIGVWQEISAEAWPIREIHVSERGRFGSAVINGEEQGVGDLGYVVANRALGAALWKRIGDVATIDLFAPGGLRPPGPVADRMTLQLDSGRHNGEILARLLVVADGARSGLREALGIPASERSYGQTAIVGNVALSDCPSRFTAYERFTSQGPLALLPIGEGRFAFVMAQSPPRAEAALGLDDQQFLRLLQQGFGRRLGTFSRLGRRSSYPLSLVRAGRTTAPRAVVIGNAAHGLHPVAGQGYNLGLRDVATLAEVIADTLRASGEVGGSAMLERYEQWRRRDQRNVVAFTDGLIRLFGLPLATAGAARGVGLALFDVVPGAKRALASRTMGMTGTLTRLARGLPL